ncbi:hypothetical protein AYI69_g1654 [Smittium culicis]|uniref:Uncharacterized protein n=1 Tax=Smittium culicis TaxID=133412 RepID=A0A1R1YPP5_9FUNG|nr:hypothetical protein AYI69_g4046 [Smittium culicis]OMJ28864.1 hypothetical protein AYI69_g1654 [Smittium culicis]
MASYKYRKTELYDGFKNVHKSVFSAHDEDFNRMRRRKVGPAFCKTGLDSVESLSINLFATNIKADLNQIFE